MFSLFCFLFCSPQLCVGFLFFSTTLCGVLVFDSLSRAPPPPPPPPAPPHLHTSLSTTLCYTHPLQLSHAQLCQPSLSTTIFHIHISTIFVNHHLSHTYLSTIFVNHHLSHTYFNPFQLYHTQLCQPSLSTTIFHIHISTIFVKHHLSHTCQPPSFTYIFVKPSVAYISVKPSVSTIFVNHLCQPPSFTYIFLKPSVAALCVAGVALGDIDLRFAWQAWHLWRWVARLDHISRG